jgi:hypothetical protein
VLDKARRGVLPGQVRTGVTLADAAAEWPATSSAALRAAPPVISDMAVAGPTMTSGSSFCACGICEVIAARSRSA